MNTKFIGIKDFRKNVAYYAKQAKRGKSRFVITKRNEPMFEMIPFDEDDYSDEFIASVKAAEEDVKKGNVYTHEEVVKHLGLS